MRVTLPESQRGVLAWLALTVFACYCNALSGAFQFDDYKVIVDNPRVHSWSSWMEGLTLGIRPLLKLTYTLNWTSGLGVAGFHLTNLLIHLCNAYLVYRLAGEFIRQQPLRERLTVMVGITPFMMKPAMTVSPTPTLPQNPKSFWPGTRERGRTNRYAYFAFNDVPLFTALLFAAHPIHTEVVTYICGRSISLMMLFYLAGLLAYVTGRTQHNKISLYLITPLSFVIALSVKETAVTFPLALLAWELCCGGAWKTSLRQQWPSWAVLLIGALFFLFNDNYVEQMERSAKLNSLQGNVATQLFAFSYLMRQWALPLWLNIDPDLPLLHAATGITLPLVFFVAACALMLACWRRRPWIGFALAWAMIQLIPLHLFLPRLDIANDRQMVLADWPLFLALTTELALWMRIQAFRVAASVLLLTLACLTVLRNQVYANEIALWEDTVKQSPHKARVHNNLGYAYMLAHRNEDARREFTAALQFDPLYYKARNNLDRLTDMVSAPHPMTNDAATLSVP